MSRVVIVTGGASGIGRAMCRGFAAKGDHVVVADVDADGARRVADELAAAGAASARAAGLDVRDADAVAALVHDVHAEHGRLDVMVNNAGIGVGGETQGLDVAHWDRVIDVNLRGVVHGVAAAYPLMVAQGSGHLLNTASLAGLVPAPMLAPYAATKHAVVGLSVSLRAEAAAHGVGVTVLCPGFTDTAILDSAGPADLRPTELSTSMREALGRTPLADADDVAAAALRGIERNSAFVVVPRTAKLAWWLARVSPALMGKLAADQAAALRRRVSRGAAPAAVTAPPP
jgi:NAD(P)-dependent dehydrogenase (short-subunit alcohol dehydrogenase family)